MFGSTAMYGSASVSGSDPDAHERVLAYLSRREHLGRRGMHDAKTGRQRQESQAHSRIEIACHGMPIAGDPNQVLT